MEKPSSKKRVQDGYELNRICWYRAGPGPWDATLQVSFFLPPDRSVVAAATNDHFDLIAEGRSGL